MIIIEALVKLRNDLKTWVANNLRVVQTQLDGKAPSNHIHSGYCTEADVQAMLDAFAERYGMTTGGSGSGTGGSGTGGTTTTVKFTVNSTAYTVDSGTVWGEWAATMGSSWVISGTHVYTPDGSFICQSGSTASNYSGVSSDSVIVAGDYYSLAVLQGDPGSGSGSSGSTNISFTVDGTSYSAAKDTTWYDFAQANSTKFNCQLSASSAPVTHIGHGIVAYNGTQVSGSDTIVNGRAYTCLS